MGGRGGGLLWFGFLGGSFGSFSLQYDTAAARRTLAKPRRGCSLGTFWRQATAMATTLRTGPVADNRKILLINMQSVTSRPI